MSYRILTATISLLALTTLSDRLPAQALNTISLRDRAMTASKIYQQVTTFFPDLSQKQFDLDYKEYLTQILGPSDDRRDFDLASMALIATLHDGHTWFSDNWLDQNYGQPVGFRAYPWEGRWVVVRSARSSISVGDVIEAFYGDPIQQFFERNRKYLSASSERDAATSLFDTPVVFPERFTLALDGGRQVVIDRKNEAKKQQAPHTEGRWLVPGSVAYIKVPHFHGIETQAGAFDLLKQFHDAKTLVLDVRGNPGAGDGGALQRSLMDRPYSMWTVQSSMHGGLLLRQYDVAYPEASHVTTTEATVHRLDTVFSGRLILLIDRECSCACEDFVMPFKINKRAQLLGETTAGTFSFTNFTQFENGMRLNVASIRHTFPDGSRFEGVGIAPDIEIHPTVQDLKSARDVVLDRALAIATKSHD